jgi:hypothetical protein
VTRDEQIAVIERMGGIWQEIAADLRRLAALDEAGGGRAYTLMLEQRLKEEADRIASTETALHNLHGYVVGLEEEVKRLRAGAQVVFEKCWTCGGSGEARLVDDDGCVYPPVACPVCGQLREALEPPVEGVPGEGRC